MPNSNTFDLAKEDLRLNRPAAFRGRILPVSQHAIKAGLPLPSPWDELLAIHLLLESGIEADGMKWLGKL